MFQVVVFYYSIQYNNVFIVRDHSDLDWSSSIKIIVYEKKIIFFNFFFQFMPFTEDRLVVSGAADNRVTN